MKTFEGYKRKKNSEIVVDKLFKLFNEIKLKNHEVERYSDPDAVTLYRGEYGLFTVEDFMFFENEGESEYPFLDEYISSKIPGSSPDYVDLDTVPFNVQFSKKEYDIFKDSGRFGL